MMPQNRIDTIIVSKDKQLFPTYHFQVAGSDGLLILGRVFGIVGFGWHIVCSSVGSKLRQFV